MFRSYLDVRDWVEGFIPLVYGKENLGLARIENLLKHLGNPQKEFKSVLVAGTAGKGSTCWYIAKLLEETMKQRDKAYKDDKGRKHIPISTLSTVSHDHSVPKIGLHVSPHLVDIRERIQILESQKSKGKSQKEQHFMPMRRFIGLANEIKPVVDAIIAKQPRLTPSYFEILVAMTFLYFAKESVDLGVVEVGLGGRLDATNVLDQELSVITNVGLDHMEILGNSIEKIAKEKAGIIKVPAKGGSASGGKGKRGKGKVVTAAQGKALKVIEKVANSKKAQLITLNTQGKIKQGNSDSFGYINEPYYILRQYAGDFASQNKNLALLSVLSLGITPDAKAVKKAFATAFPGRFELVNDDVVLDGAHNPDKVKALITAFKNHKKQTTNYKKIRNSKIQNSKLFRHPELDSGSMTLVIAFKKGKRWKKMVDLLVNNLPVKFVIATEYQAVTDTGLGSAVDATEIAKYIKSKWKGKRSSKECKVESNKNSQEAVFKAISSSQLAIRSSEKSNIEKRIANSVLVTGSLYLIGEARTLWHLPEF